MATQAMQKMEQPRAIAPSASEFTVMRDTAGMLVKTGFLPQSIKTAEQAMAIILTGRELGIGMMAALNSINVVQGKPTISPQLMLALIERSGQLEDIQIQPHDGNSMRCTMKRKGRTEHTEYFGETEARALGLLGKDNYKKQAFTMYRWRAVAACARVIFADVILGLYTPDEMGANVDDEGEIVLPDNPPLRISPRPETQNTEPETIDAEPVETISISALCKELKAAGDLIDWNAKTLLDFTNQLLGSDYTELSALTDEEREHLAESLQERLSEFHKVA
jgi:hypothetical protein